MTSEADASWLVRRHVRTDVQAVGVVRYEMLTGQLPRGYPEYEHGEIS